MNCFEAFCNHLSLSGICWIIFKAIFEIFRDNSWFRFHKKYYLIMNLFFIYIVSKKRNSISDQNSNKLFLRNEFSKISKDIFTMTLLQTLLILVIKRTYWRYTGKHTPKAYAPLGAWKWIMRHSRRAFFIEHVPLI